MKLLVVSPDYASHYLPLAAVAAEARARGLRVTVATGESLRSRVLEDGFEWCHLRLAAGANPGRLDRRDAGTAEADDLAPFFAATRLGMVATLRQQAERRSDDLLWRPHEVAAELRAILRDSAPDLVLVDHLCFSATLALRASGEAFTTFVAGHPTQLPVDGEVFGVPAAWPRCITAAADELAELRRLCEQVTTRCTARYNAVLAALAPSSTPVEDLFAAHGAQVLFNSPALLVDPRRTPLLPDTHTFLGATLRREGPTPAVGRWLDGLPDRGFAYVSMGTFLSARDDVLARVAAALRTLDVPTALATGTADPAALGELPTGWLVAPVLPQVALLARAGVVVTHGGNNTVTESLASGCPLVALPMSTDQFAVAADLERVDLGVALDPNQASVEQLVEAIGSSLGPVARERSAAVSAEMSARPGTSRAVDALLAPGSARSAPGSGP